MNEPTNEGCVILVHPHIAQYALNSDNKLNERKLPPTARKLKPFYLFSYLLIVECPTQLVL